MFPVLVFALGSFGCGRTAIGHKGANSDRNGGADGSFLRDAEEGQPQADLDGPTGNSRDSATLSYADLDVAMPDRDSGVASPDAASDAGEDCCEVGLAACASYVATGPAVALPRAALPSVRLGSSYAVLSTVNTRVDWSWYGGSIRYWYNVTFSVLDPKAGAFSNPVTSYPCRGNDAVGVPIDCGAASPEAIASYPDGYAVAWSVYRQSATSLWFALLDSGGAGTGASITLDDKAQGPCEIAWDGTYFGVAWTSWGGALRFARLDTRGALVSVTEVVPTTWLGPVRLFWDGSGYGLFWENILQALDEIWFARLDASGNSLVAPMLLTSPDNYAGALLVEPIEEGYVAYWYEMSKSGGGPYKVDLHKLGKDGQPLGPLRPLAYQACGVQALTRSGSEFGAICGSNNAIGFAGLGRYESTSISPVLSVGLPLPGREGILSATVSALRGHDDLFDIFWSGSVDGLTWGDRYFTQVRCAP
jgi:hypothetical protein